MNMTSHDRLKGVSQDGDIDGIYTLLQEDPHVLECIDSIPFVETPLHVAVSNGHLQFATEIITLKPSFAWKLNPQGFTPMHLALELGHKRMILRFVQINKDIIRVKGRKGLTPLHFVSQKGEIDLLTKFLDVCPDSIEDVDVRNETALHVAMRHEQYVALQVLVMWLMRTSQVGATHLLEQKILNWKNEDGNTILHISASQNNFQMIQLLVKTKVDLMAKNYEGRSALDISTNEEIRSILVAAKADSKITLIDKIVLFTSDITEDKRNAYLIIATLVTTATYQSVLSPPGGVYQANAGDNNANTTTLSSKGVSVLSTSIFNGVSLTTTLSFVVSVMTIVILTPPGIVGTILLSPIYFFAVSYLLSLNVISPSKLMRPVAFAIIVPLLWLHAMTYLASKRGNKRLHGR